MDPRDRPRPLPDGATCTACGAPVPTGRIRILARRDDLAFVELACDGCGSAALGLLSRPTAADDAPVLDVAADGPAAGAGVARSTIRPITQADVEADPARPRRLGRRPRRLARRHRRDAGAGSVVDR